MKHHIHVENGMEFAGETYIWCSCKVRLETISLANLFAINPDDKSVFTGKGIGELQTFLRKHANHPPANGHRQSVPTETF